MYNCALLFQVEFVIGKNHMLLAVDEVPMHTTRIIDIRSGKYFLIAGSYAREMRIAMSTFVDNISMYLLICWMKTAFWLSLSDTCIMPNRPVTVFAIDICTFSL